MTAHSAAADLYAREAASIPSQSTAKIATGVWIDKVDWALVPAGFIPELQVRARSSLAFKHSIMLANGVGTVDADYPDEICVLLFNAGKEPFTITPGDRVAQLALNLLCRLPELPIGGQRVGGFGSTDRRETALPPPR